MHQQVHRLLLELPRLRLVFQAPVQLQTLLVVATLRKSLQQQVAYGVGEVPFLNVLFHHAHARVVVAAGQEGAGVLCLEQDILAQVGGGFFEEEVDRGDVLLQHAAANEKLDGVRGKRWKLL